MTIDDDGVAPEQIFVQGVWKKLKKATDKMRTKVIKYFTHIYLINTEISKLHKNPSKQSLTLYESFYKSIIPPKIHLSRLQIYHRDAKETLKSKKK